MHEENLVSFDVYHRSPICYHQDCNDLIGRESEPPVTVGLDKSDREAIDEIDKDEHIESISYPPFAVPRV